MWFFDFFTYTKNQNLVFWNASWVKKPSEMNVSRRVDSPRYPVFDFSDLRWSLESHKNPWAKLIFKKIRVPYPDDINVNISNFKNKIKKITFTFPIVIKPVNEGSSVGVKICENINELKQSSSCIRSWLIIIMSWWKTSTLFTDTSKYNNIT